jgi:hypothetical protein
MKDMAQLADELYQAKKAEDEAKTKRIEVEEQIAALVETDVNGSKTVKASDHFKVTVKRAMKYTADMNTLFDLTRGMDADLIPIKVIPEQHIPEMLAFDEKLYEGLREKNPEVFNKLARCVNATPAKVSVTLKLA